jgi:ornithine carbamoyltransferase
VETFAKHVSIPVINGLSDLEHPCQTLADLMTIKEHKRGFKGMKIAWIGDGNNVCNSLIGGCAIMGMDICVACPPGYEPDEEIIRKARGRGCEVIVQEEPKEAAVDADVLYTDTWVSMGDEADKDKRIQHLRKYQINRDLVRTARDDVIVMHCMPVHIGEEITEDVLYGYGDKSGSRSNCKVVIFEQAENRLHTQKALLLHVFWGEH